MKSTSRAVGSLSVILAIFLAVSALGAQVPDSDSSSSNIRLAGRNLLARPTPKPTKIGTKTAPKAAPTKVALLASSSVQTSGKQGGTGTNSLKAVFKTTKGSAQGTVLTARGFAVNKAKQLTLTASKGNKVKGSIAVSSKLSSSSKSHSHNLAMGLRLQKSSTGRHLSAVCDSVPILVTAYYTISCAELNIVLTSVGLNKSTTCDNSIGDQIFISSVQYNISSNSSQSYTLPASFDGFSSIDIELLDASCGSLVVNNIDISVSAGVLSVTPIVKKWASSQIVVAVGNNTIDVRGKNSQSTFDLGGQPSKIITGIHRYNSFDNNKQLIAVNLLVCKYSTSELANIAISPDGTHSVVDTFAIQDKTGTIVQPIKTICSFYDATCLIQAYRSADDATLLLTFNVLDIVARSSSDLPIPTDSIILDGAVGGFAVADSNTIYYGSGNGITMTDTDSEESASASVSARDHGPDHGSDHDSDHGSGHGSGHGSDRGSNHGSDAPAPGPMQPNSGIPFENAVMCSDVVLDYKFTLKGSYNRLASLLYTTVVACGPEVVEYSNGVITDRRGTSLTADGSSWRAVIDIDYSLGVVYNNIRADYIAVTNAGGVAAFKLGSTNEPSVLYNVTLTAGSAGIAVIELPASN